MTSTVEDTTGGAPAVEVRGLVRTFGKAATQVVAVDGLDFEVRRGELFGLVGSDGAGKTTTLRMLAGVLRPTAGTALVLGVDVARNPEAVKSRVAYMSQRFGLYADLTVIENLSFYADLFEVPRRERDRRIERLFRFSGLEPFRDRLAGKLSGGMKQKLSLSCALVHQPEVLLLDEPTFGVDPVSRRDLWLIVHEMVASGVTAIVSTAYLDEAERFDRLALVHRGRLLALETPSALRRSLEGELLEVRGERLRDAQRALAGHPAALRTAVFGERMHVQVSDAARDAPQIAAALAGAGFPSLEVTRIEPSLEDVFLDRIARAEREEAA